jgi:exosortase/archaeosortase family protein
MDKRTQRKKIIKEVFLFLLRFNILLIPFYLIIYFDLNFYPLQIAFTDFLAFIIKSLNYKVSTSGFLLFLGDSKYPIDISRDCIGWKSSYSLFALVFATPGKIKNKLKFLGMWIPILLLINVFRVVGIILIGLNFGFQYVESVHEFIWQEGIILLVVGIWYIWLRRGKLNIKKIKNIV